MKVINIHERTIASPLAEVQAVFATLASPEDLMWPQKQWPRMKLDKGLAIGSRGGHGPIRYHVNAFTSGELIQFQFERPQGFKGVHRFTIQAVDEQHTHLHHIIDMQARGSSILAWLLGIRWLHDALIEDAFDQVENHLCGTDKRSPWNWWVRTLRAVLK